MNRLIFLLLYSTISLSLYADETHADQSNPNSVCTHPCLVQVKTEQADNGELIFYADNSYVIPCFITIKLTKLINIKPAPENPFSSVLPAGRKRIYLFSLKPDLKPDLKPELKPDPKPHLKLGYNKKYSYSFSYSYILGDPTSVHHNDLFPYLLPYEKGSRHLVSQGYNGQYSHRGIFALDFAMETGTPVTAARGGIVALVKQDSNKGGPDSSYKNDANYILIYHDDGSFGSYVHLRKDGAVVKEGERIHAGDIIGYSGNTGFSSQPHLHFDVSIPILEGGRRTIPVKFLSQKGSLINLEEGKYYYSSRPGSASNTAVR